MNLAFAVPFARASDGTFVDVDQVPRGAACNCVCDACEQRVAARKFKYHDRQDHFYHLKETSCQNPYETILRKVIFQELNRAKQIFLPECEFSFCTGKKPKAIGAAGLCLLDEVMLCARQENWLPDILLRKGDRTLALAIEPHGSIDRHVAAGRSVLQLSLPPMHSLSGVAALLTEADTGKRWLHHARVDELRRTLDMRMLPSVFYRGLGANIPDCPRLLRGEIEVFCHTCPYSGGELQAEGQPCYGHNRPAFDAFVNKYRDLA